MKILEDRHLSDNKVELISNLCVIEDPNKDLRNKAFASDGVSLPEASEKQPDLLYVKSIFVSTGANQNGAFFMPSELVKARESIPNKAVDLFHEEQSVVGHIIDFSFQRQDEKGSVFDAVGEMKRLGEDAFEDVPFDIAIMSIIHKMRFPELADGIHSGSFKVSMETFFKDFEILLDGILIPKEEAIKAGLIELIGRDVKVLENQKPKKVAKVLRVLRDLHFGGVGLVDDPANPRSVILEAASKKELVEDGDETPVIHMENIESYAKAKFEDRKIEVNLVTEKEDSALLVPSNSKHRDELCVSFKRHRYDKPPEDAGAQIVGENFCALFDADCPVAGASLDVGCLRNVLDRTVKDEIKDVFSKLFIERLKQEGMEPSDVGIDDTVRVHNPGTDFNLEEIVRIINQELEDRDQVIPVDKIADKANFNVELRKLKKRVEEASRILEERTASLDKKS